MTTGKYSRVVSPLCVSVFFMLAVVAVQAREEVQDFSIQDALSSEAARQKLSGEVTFYFGNAAYPEPARIYGTFRTNKKTNALRKSDQEVCHHAFLAAMVALEERALREGGNAVVDIKSSYDNNLTDSKTTFKCGAGSAMAGVVLEGRVVKLPNSRVLPVGH